MKERVNKPRVFLSHSKKDRQFIHELSNDLRRCQIEPWLDEYEIRHGQPWLEAIFEDGLPTCDAIIAYMTKNSITSPVVRKEIDVGLLKKLKDNHIAFLPYVEKTELRDELRADLQTFQIPEWSTENYTQILPQVVAEIWHSFLERNIKYAVQKERLARVEAELRLAEYENKALTTTFTPAENQDFEYIWNKLNRYEPVTYRHLKGTGRVQKDIGNFVFFVHTGALLFKLSSPDEFIHEKYDITRVLRSLETPSAINLLADETVELFSSIDIADELLMYGFITRFHKGTVPRNEKPSFVLMGDKQYVLMYTEKLERFKYWLAVKELIPEELCLKTENEIK